MQEHKLQIQVCSHRANNRTPENTAYRDHVYTITALWPFKGYAQYNVLSSKQNTNTSNKKTTATTIADIRTCRYLSTYLGCSSICSTVAVLHLQLLFQLQA